MKNDMPERERRMRAYYYGFDKTGIEAIDIILSAVACAGKAYHHTDGWTDDADPYEDCHSGNTPAEWIQNAANKAAKEYAALKSQDKPHKESYDAGYKFARETEKKPDEVTVADVSRYIEKWRFDDDVDGAFGAFIMKLHPQGIKIIEGADHGS